ncbi:MAG TPA: helicase-associated domain-containing protein [Candidatus Agrococcus pullicola]|uniref:Helicase-associated domain-containing protein n=1 Tax=Candidatus Agrococcus pullicola TaxID=2838429 RepID=A0A9D1YV51_9MICO|nr:helicase-associated domain-containing protein [Candidatus Agrococcus pullicola]
MTESELIGRLEQLSDTEFDDLLRDWRVPHDTASMAAVASWMRTPEAVDSALARTPASDLAALVAGRSTPTLSARGIDPSDALAARIPELPQSAESDTAKLSDDERRSAADRAVASTVAMSGLVASAAENPVALTSRGIPLAREQRARSAELSVSVEAWEALVDAAKNDGLVAVEPGRLCVTQFGLEWLALTPADRWLELRRLFLARRTLSERHLLESVTSSDLADALPLAGDALLAEMKEVFETAEHLGLVQRGVSTGLVREDVAARIPDPIDYVYLQPDLTVVAPGPLRRSIEERLASMTAAESRGIASSWRLTPASVQRALALGTSADALLEELAELSLTGVPQPVEYLVRDTERRFGTLLVQEHGGPDSSRITSDSDTHKRLLVDRSLVDLRLRVPLGNGVHNGVLVADFPAEEVLARLAQARYPALLANAAGEPVVPARIVAASPRLPEVSGLTSRLRGHGIDTRAVRAEWLEGQLSAAAKLKTPLRVTVESGAQIHHTTIVPLSIRNGRLRGRDIERDLERTLPLRAITEIAGLQPTAEAL